jgi:hypothetical protein
VGGSDRQITAGEHWMLQAAIIPTAMRAVEGNRSDT